MKILRKIERTWKRRKSLKALRNQHQRMRHLMYGENALSDKQLVQLEEAREYGRNLHDICRLDDEISAAERIISEGGFSGQGSNSAEYGDWVRDKFRRGPGYGKFEPSELTMK